MHLQPSVVQVGRLVEARVVWVGENLVKCMVSPGNMEAIIKPGMVSSRAGEDTSVKLSDYLQYGQVIQARIIKVGPDDGPTVDFTPEGAPRR